MSDSHAFDDAPLPPPPPRPPVQPSRPKLDGRNSIAKTWLLGAGALGVVLACCVCWGVNSLGNNSRGTDSRTGQVSSIATATFKLVTLTPWPSGVPTWTPTPEPTLSPTPGLCQTAEYSDFTLIVSQVAFDPAAKRAPKSGQRLVALEVTVGNHGSIAGCDFTLYVTADYVAETPVPGLVDGELPEKLLYPGNQLTGWLIFEITDGLDVLALHWYVAGTNASLQVGLKP